MQASSTKPAAHWNTRLATMASFVLVSLMVACLVSTFLVIIGLIYPAFLRSYLVPVCILIGLEASISQHRLRSTGFPEPRWIAFRLAEFITIIVGLRLLLYWQSGFDRLWVDISGWPETFWDSLLPMDFLIVLFLAFLAWGANSMLAEDILQLETNETQINQEMLGVEITERSQAQQRLRDMVVFMGCGLILATAIIRIAGWSGQSSPADIRQTYINAVAYFLFALVLFSLAQFSVLRMSWTVQHSRVHRLIGSRWLIYSAILIFLLALFAFLLPTSYSMGLLGTLSTWFYALLDGLRFIISLILLPFILFINWLMSLFRSPQAPEAAPPVVPPPLTLNGPLFQGDWFELLKSSLFWITLVGMIGFSAYFFLKENRELFGNLLRIPIFRSIAGFLSRAIRWIQNGFRRVTAGVSASIALVRKSSRQATESSGPRFFNPRRMDYRRQVIFYYLAMLRRAAEHGVPRSASQTPAEYSRRLAEALESSELAALTPSKDFNTDVTSLTDEFNKARYSRQSTSREDAGLARESWNHIRRMIQALLPTRRIK